MVRTSGFHPGNRGSIPLWTTTLKRKAYPTVGLLYLYQQHIDHMVQLTGTEYAYNTVRRYKSSLNSLKRFMNFNDIELSKLGFEFVRDYYGSPVQVAGNIFYTYHIYNIIRTMYFFKKSLSYKSLAS